MGQEVEPIQGPSFSHQAHTRPGPKLAYPPGPSLLESCLSPGPAQVRQYQARPKPIKNHKMLAQARAKPMGWAWAGPKPKFQAHDIKTITGAMYISFHQN